VKGKSKMQDEKAIWYENYKPIKEYLDNELSKKSTITENDPKTVRFSWSEIIKKSFTAN
jgi:hypothetical protein